MGEVKASVATNFNSELRSRSVSEGDTQNYELERSDLTLSKNKTRSDSLVGYRCEQLSDLQLDAGFYNMKYLNACYEYIVRANGRSPLPK